MKTKNTTTKLTKSKKVKAVMESPEVFGAVKLMLLCMNDVKANNQIQGDYILDNIGVFRLRLERIA